MYSVADELNIELEYEPVEQITLEVLSVLNIFGIKTKLYSYKNMALSYNTEEDRLYVRKNGYWQRLELFQGVLLERPSVLPSCFVGTTKDWELHYASPAGQMTIKFGTSSLKGGIWIIVSRMGVEQQPSLIDTVLSIQTITEEADKRNEALLYK